MQLVNITVGGNRIGINLDNIVSITWNDKDHYMKGGTAKMIDGSTIALDAKAMIKIDACASIVERDFDTF